MKFSTDIHDPQRMNSNDFGDPLTFFIVPPAGQSFHSSSEIPQHLQHEFCTDIHGSQRRNDFDPETLVSTTVGSRATKCGTESPKE